VPGQKPGFLEKTRFLNWEGVAQQQRNPLLLFLFLGLFLLRAAQRGSVYPHRNDDLAQ
jgi:hypothetical protein